MDGVCIALVDARHARLFTFGRAAGPTESRGELVERSELVNPQRRSGSLLRGHRRLPPDDRFARMMLAALRELIDDHATQRVVLCAAPWMLETLRAAAPGILPRDVALAEIPRDLAGLTAVELRATLAALGILPAA